MYAGLSFPGNDQSPDPLAAYACHVSGRIKLIGERLRLTRRCVYMVVELRPGLLFNA